MCVYFVLKLLTLLFSTPITVISADTLCNFCSLLSLFQRSAPFLPLANPGGLQGIIKSKNIYINFYYLLLFIKVLPATPGILQINDGLGWIQ